MIPEQPQIKYHSQTDRLSARAAGRHLVKSANEAVDRGDLSKQDSFDNKLEENNRELGTRHAAGKNISVATLEEMADAGFPTEASGDALARVKAGKPGKLHNKV